MGCCEYGNEPSNSMKCGKVLGCLKTCWILKKVSVPCSQSVSWLSSLGLLLERYRQQQGHIVIPGLYNSHFNSTNTKIFLLQPIIITRRCLFGKFPDCVHNLSLKSCDSRMIMVYYTGYCSCLSLIPSQCVLLSSKGNCSI